MFIPWAAGSVGKTEQQGSDGVCVAYAREPMYMMEPVGGGWGRGGIGVGAAA